MAQASEMIAIDRLNPPVVLADLSARKENTSYPSEFVLGYAKTIAVDLSFIGRKSPLFLVVPMTPQEVKEIKAEEGFDGFFLPISAADYGRNGSCRELSVPRGDVLTTASPQKRLKICPPWNRLFGQETLAAYGADGAQFIEYQEIEW